MSSQLLVKLQQSKDDPLWAHHPSLLIWLLYIGGAFAPPGFVRSGYITLVRSNNTTGFGDMYESWDDLLEILNKFTWSEKAFFAPVKEFWGEVFDQNIYINSGK
jgi:hypothetical protein